MCLCQDTTTVEEVPKHLYVRYSLLEMIDGRTQERGKCTIMEDTDEFVSSGQGLISTYFVIYELLA